MQWEQRYKLAKVRCFEGERIRKLFEEASDKFTSAGELLTEFRKKAADLVGEGEGNLPYEHVGIISDALHNIKSILYKPVADLEDRLDRHLADCDTCWEEEKRLRGE